MTKLILSIIVTGILAFQTVYAGPALNLNPRRTVKVVGPIENLRKQSAKILRLSEESKKPIYVLVNSFGGSVFAGIGFVQAIDRVKTRGVKVKCVVTGSAMSMATHILSACSHRYALPTSLIMWHPMAMYAMFIKLTEENTGHMNRQFKLLSEYLDKRLKTTLGISEKKYREFEKGEYIMFGVDLRNKVAPKFLKIVEDVRFKN